MTSTEQAAYIEGIRQRRLAPIEAYKRAMEAKQIIKDEKLLSKLDKEIAMMDKELAALDTALAKVEKRMLTLAGLRLLADAKALRQGAET